MTGKQRGSKISRPRPPTTRTEALRAQHKTIRLVDSTGTWNPSHHGSSQLVLEGMPGVCDAIHHASANAGSSGQTHHTQTPDQSKPPVPPFSLSSSRIFLEDSLQLGLTAMPFNVMGRGCGFSCTELSSLPSDIEPVHCVLWREEENSPVCVVVVLILTNK